MTDNITQAAANKAAEEGKLPALQFDVETRDELTDDQNQRLDNLRTLNELLICFSSWEPQVCVVGNVRAGDAANAVRQAIAADRASRQVANKAEIEPLTATHGPIHLTNRKTAEISRTDYNIIGYVLRREDGDAVCISAESAVRWLPEAHYWRLMHEQDGSLFATPPATTGAIPEELAIQLLNALAGRDPKAYKALSDFIFESSKSVGASTDNRPTDDELWDATLRDRDAYHEWADKLADAIAKHFGVDIGEHSNQNLPWDEALQAIENAEPVGASTVLTNDRISALWLQSERHYDFARAIERELAAQAGQVAATVLSEELTDRIARNYFSEQWAVQHAKDAIHDALTEASAVGEAAVPEGFVLVPVKPTPKMVDATFNHIHLGSESHNARNKRIYAAMLAAAPSPAKESK